MAWDDNLASNSTPPEFKAVVESEVSTMESSRLKHLNERTLCICFPKVSQFSRPSSESLALLFSSCQSMMRPTSANPRRCFMIFATKEDRDQAASEVHGQRCEGHLMLSDGMTKLVPVSEDNLDETRETTSLAVHGIPWRTEDKDVLEAFPRAENCTVAKRGGTAFVNYANSVCCLEDFKGKGDLIIHGVAVSVLFSHSMRRKRSFVGDLREKIDCSKREWVDFLQFMSNLNDRNTPSPLKEIPVNTIERILSSSELKLERMRKQFNHSPNIENDVDIKTEWLDVLTATYISSENINFSNTRVLERGWLRELVENIWKFLTGPENFPLIQKGSGLKREHVETSPITSPVSDCTFQSLRTRTLFSSTSPIDSSPSPPSKYSRKNSTSPEIDEHQTERLPKFLNNKLQALGLSVDGAAGEVDLITDHLGKILDLLKDNSSLTKSHLRKLLVDSGYSSSHVNTKLAAEWVNEWLNLDHKETTKFSEKEKKSITGKVVTIPRHILGNL